MTAASGDELEEWVREALDSLPPELAGRVGNLGVGIAGGGAPRRRLARLPQGSPPTARVSAAGGVMAPSPLSPFASAGCAAAVLVERETLGAGSTSKAAGGIR